MFNGRERNSYTMTSDIIITSIDSTPYKRGMATKEHTYISPKDLSNTLFSGKNLQACHEVIIQDNLLQDRDSKKRGLKLFLDIDFKSSINNSLYAASRIAEVFASAIENMYAMTNNRTTLDDIKEDIIWFGRVPQSGPKKGCLSMHIFHITTAISVSCYKEWTRYLSECMIDEEPELLTNDVFDINLVKTSEWYCRTPYATKYASYDKGFVENITYDNVLVHSSAFNEFYSNEVRESDDEVQDMFDAHILMLKKISNRSKPIRRDITASVISDTSMANVFIEETADMWRRKAEYLQEMNESLKREKSCSGATEIAVQKMFAIIAFLKDEVRGSGLKLDHYDIDYDSDGISSEEVDVPGVPNKSGKRFFNDFHSKITMIQALRGHNLSGFIGDEKTMKGIIDILMMGIRYYDKLSLAKERAKYYWDVSENSDMQKAGLGSFVKAAKSVLPSAKFAKMMAMLSKSTKEDLKTVLKNASTCKGGIDMNENYDIDDFTLGNDCNGHKMGNDASQILIMATKVIAICDRKYYVKKRVCQRPTEFYFEMVYTTTAQMKDFNMTKIGIWAGADKPTEISHYELFSTNSSNFLVRSIAFDPENLLEYGDSKSEVLNKFNKPHFQKSITDPMSDERVIFLIKHIQQNICSGDESTYIWVMKWIYETVINCSKLETSLFVQSDEFGTGKTLFFSLFMSRIIGDKYCKATVWKEIEAGNNSYMEDSLFVLIDEMPEGGANNSKVAAMLRTTSDLTSVRSEKYLTQCKIQQHCNYVMTSNYIDSIHVTTGCRRFTCVKSRMPVAENLATYKDKLFDLCYDKYNKHKDLPDLFIRALDYIRQSCSHWDNINVHESLKNEFRTDIINNKDIYQRFCINYRGKCMADKQDINKLPTIYESFSSYCRNNGIKNIGFNEINIISRLNSIIPLKVDVDEMHTGLIRFRSHTKIDGVMTNYTKYEYIAPQIE